MTIGLPTFNSESYLDACVESIAAQTYDDFQVLVVDGGSTDSTPERLERWRARDERVDIHPRPVVGLYQAFNTILSASKTRYVCIHPADDIVSPEFLKQMSQTLDTHPGAAAAISRLRVFDEQGQQEASPHFGLCWPSSAPVHRWPFDAMTGLLRENPYVSLTQILFRAQAIEKIRFRTDLGSTADILFHLTLALRHDIVHVDSTWGGWRIHPHQASQNNSDQNVKRRNLELMLDLAFGEHLRRIDDQGYRSKLQYIIDVMGTYQALAQRVSGRSHLSRWATVLGTAVRSPKAAYLYAMSRTLRREAEREWLTRQAQMLTDDRVERQIEQSVDASSDDQE
ncbi:MAG: glycosyltransferase family A protein [Planctomycetota bacterium]